MVTNDVVSGDEFVGLTPKLARRVDGIEPSVLRVQGQKERMFDAGGPRGRPQCARLQVELISLNGPLVARGE